MTLSFTANTQRIVSPEANSGWKQKPLVHGKSYMIVTNNPHASEAARAIFKKKGSAVDAAIAAAFVLGVTEPQSSGLGGGGYALSYQHAQKNILTYDGRERAPQSATPQWFLDEKGMPIDFIKAQLSTRSIGVPGEVAMLYLMHQKEGVLPWKTLLEPAITLAHKGFIMSPRLFTLLNKDKAILVKNKQIKSIYFTSTGEIKPIGALVKNIALAHTLQLIAKQPDSFYHGKIAQDMVDMINQSSEKPIYTLDDFKNYRALIKPPVCDFFRHYKVCTTPSPSSGIAVLELLKLYAARYTGQRFTDIQWIYSFIEASKLMFADRNYYIADPMFIKQSISGLLEDDYINTRSQLITHRAMQADIAPGILKDIRWHYASHTHFKPHGTTSLTIIDSQGNAVVMNLSIEHQFGSHFLVDGFFLNNQLTDFSFTPKNAGGKWIANRVEPLKRPRSSMSPMMVFNREGQLEVLAASPGGSSIICYVAKNLIQMLDFNWTPAQSAASGNVCMINNEATLEANSNLLSFIPALVKKGESIHLSSELTSGETNIKRDLKGGWWGGADPRREGEAIGD